MINFMWNGKKGKLSRDVLYKTVENGGLGVPEMGKMISVSNIKWARRFLDENVCYWKVFMIYYFRKCKLDINILLCSNFDTKRLLNDKDKVPLFYLKILHDWCQNVQTKVQRNLFIWYNKEFKIDKQPFFFKKFYVIGIKYVRDMLDKCGKAIPFETLVKMGLPRSKWLQWQSLIKVLQHYIKPVHVQVKCEEDMKFYIMGKEIGKCTSKHIYRNVSSSLNTTHVGRAEKYLINIGLETESTKWQEVYMKPTRLIMDTKSRNFQFQFLHDILVNKYWLYKWKLVDNDKCRAMYRAMV
jgi:hypothetical protein